MMTPYQRIGQSMPGIVKAVWLISNSPMPSPGKETACL